ncbi:uncharacterized protein [Rutidosis leptorrhynchoides]|uniref:uncharacterized protein n=1 Tax=Rutidosis leptorrhynchoides TaxID=125765 RepID=UPI003A9A2B2A
MSGDDDIGPSKTTQVSSLDFGDPLYLHASDTSTTSLISLKLKGTENYNVWSRAMTLALQTKNKFGFVDGSYIKSQTDNVLMLQWDRCNSVVLSWILKSISEELFSGQVFAKSAQTVCEELKENGSGNFTVSDYYHKLNALWKQFDALVKSPTCVCDANKEFKTHNDLIKLMQFLMGLDESYAYKLGHTIDRCYEIVGYPHGWVKKADPKPVMSNNSVSNINTTESVSQPFNAEKISQLMSLLHNQSTQGNAHANMAGSFLNCNVVFNSKFDTFFKSNGTINNGFNDKWIIDSGETRHMTGSCEGLVNVFDVSKLNMTVGHPNGTLAKITNIGNLQLSKNFILKDVLVIPGYCVNLLSVNKLLKDYNMFIGFTSGNCFIQDLDLKKVVGIGNAVDGLYLFDKGNGIVSNKSSMSPSLNDKCYGSANLWHSRLGHPSTHVLKILKDRIGVNPDSAGDVCEIFHKAKQSRDPFPLSDHTSSKIGDLIHLDVWGPYKVNSYGGFKSFLTIVDDNSRAMWVYLLKTKIDVFDNILCFVNLIKTLSLMLRLPSSVLHGKSPFEMIYDSVPNLFHMRVFGCLCFASTLYNSDKFCSKSEKCVFLGYSNVKKGYKLLSLESKTILFSRDVKSYETIFPYNPKSKNNNISSDNDHTNSFESVIFEPNTSQSPNDDGGDNTEEDSGSDHDPIKTSEEEIEIHGTSSTTSSSSENDPGQSNTDHGSINEPSGNPDNLRRSSRTRTFPSKFNDYYVNFKVRYPMSNYCNYLGMHDDVKCFSATLNKAVEPHSYEEACKNPKWVEAMNN